MNANKSWLSSKAETAAYLVKNFFRKRYCRKRRKNLQNRDFTIISNNCCGGVIYHNLGLQFNTPTVNLSIGSDDFFLFLENLEEALRADVSEDFVDGVSYPVGRIQLKNGRCIRLFFKHYQTFDEAAEKWYERRSRVRLDNLYVLMEMARQTNEDLLKRFFSLPVGNKFALVDKAFPEYTKTQVLNFYEKYSVESNATIMNYRKGLLTYKRYLDDFDYVKWLNSKEV